MRVPRRADSPAPRQLSWAQAQAALLDLLFKAVLKRAAAKRSRSDLIHAEEGEDRFADLCAVGESWGLLAPWARGGALPVARLPRPPSPLPTLPGKPAQSRVCGLQCTSRQPGSLTPRVRPGIEPASSLALCWVLNLLSHNGNSLRPFFKWLFPI